MERIIGKRKCYELRKHSNTGSANAPVVRAQMTIYLTLILAVLLPLITMMIDGARTSACKATLEAVTEMGMDSILAEYHKELLDRYGLLFIDTSYGEAEGSLENTKEHLKSYMSYNLHPQKELLSGIGSRDLLGLDVDLIDFVGESRATDNKGEVFRYMACRYMREKTGLALIEMADDLKKEYAEYEMVAGEEKNPNRELLEAQTAIDRITVPRPEKADKNWKEPVKDQPAHSVVAATKGGILKNVCEGAIFDTEINPQVYASHRSLVTGYGCNPDWEKTNDAVDGILFNAYILEKMGYYGNERKNSTLNYQVEYILHGKANDMDNLKAVVWQIFGIRSAINTALFSQNGLRTTAVNLMAAGLSIVSFVPSAEQAYKVLLTTAWIAAESLCDVKKLMHGKKIPIDKRSDEWETSLPEALTMNLSVGTGEGRGMDYKAYLQCMLLATGLNKKTMRAMDIIEMDIRNITKKEDFRMDNCIVGADVQFIFKNLYGHSFLMKRRFSYF